MYYLKLIFGMLVFLSVIVFGLLPLAGALILSFLTLDVAESFSIIYGQWSWLGVRVIVMMLFISSVMVSLFAD